MYFHLTQSPSDYSALDHSSILPVIISHCSRKELVLVGEEQFSLHPCPHSLPLILPLFDLSLPHHAAWLSDPLLSALTRSEECESCTDRGEEPTFPSDVLTCLGRLNPALCSDPEPFERTLLYLLDNHRSLLSTPYLLHPVLGKLRMDLPAVLARDNSSVGDHWDPRALGLASYFPNHLPLVYKHSWLFRVMLPWILLLVEDVGSFIEGQEVNPVLQITSFFVPHQFTIHSKMKDFRNLLDFLIGVAVNNTISENRRAASRSLRQLTLKLPATDQLRLVKQYMDHGNGSVAGLFVDLLRTLRDSVPRDKFNSVVTLLLQLPRVDVLECSDKILATLSLVQLVFSFSKGECVGYLDQVERLTRRRELELEQETDQISRDTGNAAAAGAGSGIPASIVVQGEQVKEPSRDEKLSSVALARCRLDLILFSLARTREAVEQV